MTLAVADNLQLNCCAYAVNAGVQTAAVNMRPETLACHVAMLLELFERGQKTQLHCVDFACIFAVCAAALASWWDP